MSISCVSGWEEWRQNLLPSWERVLCVCCVQTGKGEAGSIERLSLKCLFPRFLVMALVWDLVLWWRSRVSKLGLGSGFQSAKNLRANRDTKADICSVGHGWGSWWWWLGERREQKMPAISPPWWSNETLAPLRYRLPLASWAKTPGMPPTLVAIGQTLSWWKTSLTPA